MIKRYSDHECKNMQPTHALQCKHTLAIPGQPSAGARREAPRRAPGGHLRKKTQLGLGEHVFRVILKLLRIVENTVLEVMQLSETLIASFQQGGATSS